MHDKQERQHADHSHGSSPIDAGVGTEALPAPDDLLPLNSDTELSIDCNAGAVEGAAGIAYRDSAVTTIRIPVNPDEGEQQLEEYARKSSMSAEKAGALTRKARYYMALPIENTTGPHAGVLVVDNGTATEIMDGPSKAACERAEEQVKLLVHLVARRMLTIPDRILRRV